MILNRKWLARAGVVLLACPEPITTPVGVALLGTAIVLSRRQKRETDARIREVVTFYLAHARKPNRVSATRGVKYLHRKPAYRTGCNQCSRYPRRMLT